MKTLQCMYWAKQERMQSNSWAWLSPLSQCACLQQILIHIFQGSWQGLLPCREVISINAAMASCPEDRTAGKRGQLLRRACWWGSLLWSMPKQTVGFCWPRDMLNVHNYITLHSMYSYVTGWKPETKQCTQCVLKTLNPGFWFSSCNI